MGRDLQLNLPPNVVFVLSMAVGAGLTVGAAMAITVGVVVEELAKLLT